ncbi:MAG: glycosyltransferase family 1 protein, partial [Bacteroidetes bacterium]
PWENAYSSVSLSFTREFSKNNRVFYINMPWSVKDFWNHKNEPLAKARRPFLLKNKMRYERIEELPDQVVAVHPPLTIPVNFLPNGALYKTLRAYNDRLIVRTIEKVIADYNIKDYIYLNCYNPYCAGTLPKRLKPLLNIYQCIDDMTQEAYTARHGARLEEEVIAAADLVFVTSKNLHRLKSPLNPHTHILHNAADLSIFSEAREKSLPRPPEIAHVRGKMIGFTGNMDPNRVDYSLLKKIACRHTDKTLVLVGPINNEEYKTVGLDQLPNVIMTGGKHIRELPAFLQHFDVTIIPFRKNTLTASIYPLKINEYLATGKPVVSTDFSEDIRGFGDVIYLAPDDDAFLHEIDRAIVEDNTERAGNRVTKAAENTWTERVRQFWEIVEARLEMKTPAPKMNV